ncbi:MAG TPA: tetratricopeptide repeat protein [Dongiaceae bacterium]|nr:tetratricopeptide repeat protein [Dongiaceae bacterium]
MLLIAAAAFCIAPRPVRAADDPNDLWHDPTFQRQFLGTYGAVSELEPKLTQIEREQMEKIMTLMAADLDGAARALQAAATPTASAVFDFTLGNVHFQKERLEEAATAYRAAVSKFPAFRRAHKNLGLVLVRTGKTDEAIKPLSRVIELGGGDGLTYGLLGACYAAGGQYASAESAYRNAVLLQGEVLDWKLGLAQVFLKQKQYGEALALADDLLRTHPDRAELWLLQANAHLGLNEPLEAAESYEILHRMGKGTPQTFYTLGDIYVNQQLYDVALGSYRQAIEAKPDQPLDRPLRSVEILAQRNAFAQAAELGQLVKTSFADRLDDAQRKSLLRLEARIALASGGDAAQAINVLEEVVALDPLDGDALMLLAQHYGKNGDPDKALFYYERAQGIEAYEADARVRSAQILVSQSKFKDAVPQLKRAQELKPRDEVARYLEQVERLARARPQS